MQLLEKFNTNSEAESAAMLLKANGIVTHVGSHTGITLNGMLHGVTEVPLWVVLDQQFDDAKALLNDDQHVATSGLTEQEMARYVESGESYVFRSLNRAILIGVVLIVLVFLFTSWVLTSW